MKIIDRFEVPYYQYMDENGQFIDEIPLFAQNSKELLTIYREMLLARTVDAKAIALQRTGKLGTYPSTRGQEAVFVGVGHAMAKEDILVPYYRDMAALMQRGVSIKQILLYWGGDERGNVFDKNVQDFPFSVPVGSQLLHGAGAAFALKYKKQKQAVIAMCGDGATSQGDFYEAMNVAGIWKLPVVFVVCNNQWAISVSRDAQTATHTIAQKAIAAGFSGEQVDGNDVIAVIERTKVALEKARNNFEPTLLELVCYRQHDHTTADDASRYEPKNIREAEWKKEPIIRLQRYLKDKGLWNPEIEETMLAEIKVEVENGVAEYLSEKPAPLTSMFDYLYAELPSMYAEQRSMLEELQGNHE